MSNHKLENEVVELDKCNFVAFILILKYHCNPCNLSGKESYSIFAKYLVLIVSVMEELKNHLEEGLTLDP